VRLIPPPERRAPQGPIMRGIVGTDSGNDAEDENDSHRASLLRNFLGTLFVERLDFKVRKPSYVTPVRRVTA
jgi:hypothetical protein